MKRYWIFGYSTYYPQGGMSDFMYDFDTLVECNNFLQQYESFESDGYYITNYQIFNSETRIVVIDAYREEIKDNISLSELLTIENQD